MYERVTGTLARTQPNPAIEELAKDAEARRKARSSSEAVEG